MIETERSPFASTIGKCNRVLRLDSLPDAGRDGLFVIGAFVVVVGLLRVSEIAGGLAGFSTLAWVAWRRPGWLLALALTGTFVYLGALALGGRSPHSTATGAYDAMLGLLLVTIAWVRRTTILGRLRTLPARTWVAATLFLAAWFVAAVLLLARGPNATHFAGLLVLLSVPAAAAALAWDRDLLGELRDGLIGLSVVLAGVTLLGLALGRQTVNGRFIPISHYDPISAAVVVGIGALVVLATLPRSPRARLAAAATFTVLTATAFVFGARGPLVSLAVGVVVVLVLAGRRALAVAVPSLAIALVLGAGLSRYDPGDAKVKADPAAKPVLGPPAPGRPAVSSISMRRQWLEAAVTQFPDKPLFGHGVVMLVDETPESKRLRNTGLIWPHNDIAEAAHSLGLLGLLPFLVFLAVPIAALIRLARRFDRYTIAWLGGVFTFAFVESNFSGEIGADTLLWAAAALLVATWADAWRAPAR